MSFENMENYDDINKLDDVDADILDSLGINTLNDPLAPTQPDNNSYVIERDPETTESLRTLNYNDMQRHKTILEMNGGVDYVDNSTTVNLVPYVNNIEDTSNVNVSPNLRKNDDDNNNIPQKVYNQYFFITSILFKIKTIQIMQIIMPSFLQIKSFIGYQSSLNQN